MTRLRLAFLSLIGVVWLISGAASAAIVHGTVTASDTGEELIGAGVLIEGTQLGASVGMDGSYRIVNVPAGRYVLRATMLGYQTTARDITVADSSDFLVHFKLEPAAIEMGEVEITARAATGSQERELEDRLATASITDGVSSENMRRMPDPDVSQVVKRATGVSTMDGNPVIRGLGVRYSKVTLNSAQVAGTEPNRSAVPLELFPTSLMRDVTINKSYLPDQYADFGGGTVNMGTWDYPERLEFKVSSGTSVNDLTTFRSARTYHGGALDFLGFDDGTRALPDPIANSNGMVVSRGRFSETGYTTEELEQLGESFPNNWNPVKTTAAPNQNHAWSVGNRTTLSNRPLGFIVTGLYRSSNQYKETERNVFKGGVNGQLEQQHHYNFQTYASNVNLGGMALLGYSLSPTSKLSLSTLYNRDLDDETRFFSGYNDDRGKDVRDTRLRFVARSTLTSQLAGRHLLPRVGQSIFDWQVTASRGTRYEPDTREVQYDTEPGTNDWVFADESQSGSRMFSTLFDNLLNARADWTMRLNSITAQRAVNLKTGAAVLMRHRNSETRFFQFEPVSNANVDFSLNPEALFAAENIRPDGMMLRESTRPTDSYRADHNLQGGYAMMDMPVTPRVRMIGGARVENSVQQVTSYELFTALQTPVKARIATLDVLPALNIIYQMADRSNLRLAASQTVSRPDFRELTEFEFTDIIGGHAIIGNPNLKRALIRHADLRYEWVHGVADLAAVSVFYKQFVNPVEEVIQPTAQNRVSYENASSADNYGVEIELRQSLEPLVDALAPFALSTNLSIIHSDIQLSDSSKGIQTSSRRPLHGQSPYLLNVNLHYEHPQWHTQADLFLHTFGKRIAEVGSKPLPDVYEMPHPDLALGMEHPLSSHFNVRGAVANILDSEVQFKQGDSYTERFRLGRTYTLGLTYHL